MFPFVFSYVVTTAGAVDLGCVEVVDGDVDVPSFLERFFQLCFLSSSSRHFVSFQRASNHALC